MRLKFIVRVYFMEVKCHHLLDHLYLDDYLSLFIFNVVQYRPEGWIRLD